MFVNVIRSQSEDAKEIYQIWKDVFSFDDFGFTDYYFKHHFNPFTTYIIKEDQKVVSIGSFHKHVYKLNHRFIQASMIVGLATLEEYRHKGYMRAILETMLDHLASQELITFIQAYNPELYKPFGFEMVYYRKRYILTQQHIKSIDLKGVTTAIHYEDMLKVYAKFAKRFHGFMIRDYSYFKQLELQCKATNSQIVCVYEKGLMKGYGILQQFEQHVLIEELIYLDLKTLYKILSLALKVKPKVELVVSKHEQLDRVFNMEGELFGYTMARIHDYELFNQLFNSQVSSVQEAFALVDKPLFLRENI